MGLRSSAVPKFHKARTVPFMMKEKVEAELQRLTKEGIISLVKQARWAAPIVPVLKRDGSVRICGDFKVTINQASQTESYPLPRVEELFSKLSNGKHFSVLDLSQAYLQLPLDDESTDLDTHKGLYKYHLAIRACHLPAIYGEFAARD